MKEWWEDDNELDRILNSIDTAAPASVSSTPQDILEQSKLSLEAASGAGVFSGGVIFSITTALVLGFGGGWVAHQQSVVPSPHLEVIQAPIEQESEAEKQPPLLEEPIEERIKNSTIPPMLPVEKNSDEQELLFTSNEKPMESKKNDHGRSTNQDLSALQNRSKETPSDSEVDNHPQKEDDSLPKEIPISSMPTESSKESLALDSAPVDIVIPKQKDVVKKPAVVHTELEESRDIKIFAAAGVRKNSGIKKPFGNILFGIVHKTNTPLAKNLGLQLEINHVPYLRDSVVPSASMHFSLSKKNTLGESSFGVVGGVRPSVFRDVDSDEERKYKLQVLPVAGVHVGHTIHEKWFAQAQIEGALIKPKHGSSSGNDFGAPSRLWYGIQVGKLF